MTDFQGQAAARPGPRRLQAWLAVTDPTGRGRATVFKETGRRAAPGYLPPDPAGRTSYVAGETAQCSSSSAKPSKERWAQRCWSAKPADPEAKGPGPSNAVTVTWSGRFCRDVRSPHRRTSVVNHEARRHQTRDDAESGCSFFTGGFPWPAAVGVSWQTPDTSTSRDPGTNSRTCARRSLACKFVNLR